MDAGDSSSGGGLIIPPRNPPAINYPLIWIPPGNGGNFGGTYPGWTDTVGTNSGSTGTDLPPGVNLPSGNFDGSDFDGTHADAISIINELVTHLENNTSVILNSVILNAINLHQVMLQILM